jgi:hypothetical protein
MANIVFNISKGRVAELYRRVKSADPSTAALVLIPIEFTGLEADSVLIDVDTLSALIAGTTNEQTANMGRKVLVAADLATFPAPDDGNDRMEVSLPQVTWTGATGNRIAKIAVCYRNATADADTAIIPLTMFDFDQTPSGADIVMTTGVFFRAS